MVASVGRVGQSQASYTVRPGDTLSEIAQRNGVTLNALLLANPQIRNPDRIFVDQRVALPAGAGGGTAYTVRVGDTLSGIAARHGVDWRDLARDNGLSNPHLIMPGQRIRIGGGTGGAPAGGTGGATGPGAVGGAEGARGAAGNPAEVARKYLGQNAASLRSDRGDNLPMAANCPANLCCANFVSAVLIESGQLPANRHTLSVAQLDSTLRRQGWTPVSLAQARPGDVVIIQGGGVSHTEIYAGGGRMVGSNNTNADGTQRVGYDDISWAMRKGAVILRAPDNVRSAEWPTPAGGPAPGANVNEPAATRDGRIEQAIGFFRGQGWSEAQAIGIVANLDAESGMIADRRQMGGGPGYGLAQWEGPRQADFRAWAGKDIRQSTFAEQLRFIQHELTGSEASAGRRLRGATSAAQAAEIVCRYYERPADIAGDSAERALLAERIARER